MPAAQIIHDKYLMKWCNCYKHCFKCCSKKSDDVASVRVEKQQVPANADNTNKSETVARQDSFKVKNLEQQDRITRCMGGVFNSFVHRARVYILVILTLLGVAAIVVALQIGPLTQEDQMLPDDHPLMEL